jgi:hypothetical protein
LLAIFVGQEDDRIDSNDLTTAFALPEAQQMSPRAFTSA